MKKEILEKLLKKEITPNECKERLGVMNNEELTELLFIEDYRSRKRRLSIKEVSDMNYLDIKKYVSNKANINLDHLAYLVYLMWSNYEITGFNYRYFMESIDIPYDIRFISAARCVRRYD